MICSKENLKHQILQVITRESNGDVISDFTMDMCLSDIGIDSISFVSLLIEVENFFGVSFADDIPLMSECKTIGAMIDSIFFRIYGEEVSE